MALFDQFAKASFDGIAFPVKSYEVVGGLRDHVHEYPHSPGGAPEKLGRKLYTIRMSAIFDARITGYGDNLFPGDASDLNDRFDDQTTSDLVVPHIGTIPAYAVSWTQRASFENVSGIEVELEFREDQAQAFLVEALVNVTSTSLESAGVTFDQDYAPYFAGGKVTGTGIVLPSTPSATIPRATSVSAAYSQLRSVDVDRLTQIRRDFSQAIAYAQTPDRYAARIIATTDATIEGAKIAWERVELLKNPLAWKPLRSLKRVAASAQSLRKSVTGNTNRILFYQAQTDTSLAAISRAIYGDTSYGGSILRLNAIENPFRILKGSVLRYYDPTTIGSAA